MIQHPLLLLTHSNTYNMFQVLNNKQLSNNMLYYKAPYGYLPEVDNQAFTTESQRQQLIQQLDNKMKNEHFYFSINVQKNAITHCKGINNCLGYTDNHFSVRDYAHIIHPAHALIDAFYASALFDCLGNKKIALDTISTLTHVSLVALLHKNGHYIYCKKESRALQITSDYKMLEYSNEFTIIKEFNNEPYIFRMYDNNGQRADAEKGILQSVKTNFEKSGHFSVQELRILKRYSTKENTTNEIIGHSFKIEKSTVATYNKRILNKAENIFEHRFKNAQKVATYLKEIGLI